MLLYVLGDVVVDNGAGQQISPGPAKRAGLLAALALSANSAVPQEELIARVWGQSPPRNATTLHSHLSRLRQLLAPHPEVALTRNADGYRLEVNTERIDLFAMRSMVSHAHGYRDIGHHTMAVNQLRDAMALWRGQPLAGLRSAWASQSAVELEAEYRDIVECLFESEVDSGLNTEALAALCRAVGDYPTSESLIRTLMLAQLHCGQSDEALATFDNAWQRWREGGQEPGRELIKLRDRVAGNDPELTAPSTPLDAPQLSPDTATRQLPPQSFGFTGRAYSLRKISDAFDRGHRCVLITGMAGVGKTAVALRWAHSMSGRRGVDGQLYVDMRGGTETPTAPEDAAGVLLRALGVEAREIPTEARERLQAYRSTVAGRTLFVLLDNVSSRRQIEPLIGLPNVSVLVTSRTYISEFEGHHIEIGVLPDAEARTLLSRMLGAARVEREPAAVADLLAACGHLPLALRIAAGNLGTEHHSSITGFVAEMSQRGLSRLTVPGDDTAAVGTAFDLSYRQLSPCARVAFGMLGMLPVESFTLGSASALFGTSRALAATLLDELTAAHLLESHHNGRFGFHDLVRLFAQQHACDEHVGEDREAALWRLCTWYAGRTRAASEVLAPDFERLAVSEPIDDCPYSFPDYDSALSWMDVELDAIVKVTELAADRFPALAPRLADNARAYLFIRRHVPEWITLGETGFAAAQRNADSGELAAMHYMIGHCGSIRLDYDTALRHYPQAAKHAKSAGNVGREASARLKIANAAARVGDLEEAVAASQMAVSLTEDLDATLHGTALSVLGLVCYGRGMLAESVSHFAKGVELAGGVNNSNRIALVGNLAVAYKERGQLDDALGCVQEASRLCRERGARYQLLSVLTILAEVSILRGDEEAAARSLDELFVLLDSVDARLPRAEGFSFRALLEPDSATAVGLAAEAVCIADETGDPVARIETRLCLAECRSWHGVYSSACQSASEAREVSREVGYRNMEARTLAMEAQIDWAAGDEGDAHDKAQRALTAHRDNGNRLGEARCLLVLSRTERDTELAQSYQETAEWILGECGATIPELDVKRNNRENRAMHSSESGRVW